MGKIHDALRRAEEERAAQLGASSPAARRFFEPASRASRLLSRALGASERIARLQQARRSKVVAQGTEARVGEEFRSLRQRIQSLRRTREITSIVVTSAVAGEGKTTVATNLAFSFALEPDAWTCLVDADLRAPQIHETLPETPPAGLAELIETDAKLDEALARLPSSRLSVLPVRAIPSHPSELLASRGMAERMAELAARFDTVIVDAPPIAGLADLTALVDLCDAALLVVSAGRTSHAEVESALERIDRAKLLGAVVNRFDAPISSAYGSGYGLTPR